MNLSGLLAGGPAGLLLKAVQRSATLRVVVVDSEGRVAAVNPAFAELVGREPDEVVGRPVGELLTAPDADRLAARLADRSAPGDDEILLNFVDDGGDPDTLRCWIGPVEGGLAVVGEPVRRDEERLQRELLDLTRQLAVLSRENARNARDLRAANRELEEAIAERDRNYWHLRKIQEVLPICMECGKVKTGDASWEPVVEYLRKNSLFLSHGYCPDCAVAMRRAFGLVADDAGEGR